MSLVARGGGLKDSSIKDISMLGNLFEAQQKDENSADIRIQDQTVDFQKMIDDDQFMGAGYDDDLQGPSPIQEFGGDQSPKFGNGGLISMMHKIDQVDKQIFKEKAIEQLYEDLREDDIEVDGEAAASALAGSVPKELKKR